MLYSLNGELVKFFFGVIMLRFLYGLVVRKLDVLGSGGVIGNDLLLLYLEDLISKFFFRIC